MHDSGKSDNTPTTSAGQRALIANAPAVDGTMASQPLAVTALLTYSDIHYSVDTGTVITYVTTEGTHLLPGNKSLPNTAMPVGVSLFARRTVRQTSQAARWSCGCGM